jgi:hypothetical protein
MTQFITIHHEDGSIENRAVNADELNAISREAEKDSVKLVLTPEQVAESILAQQKYQARNYLASTDWYAARLAETGTAIPADVLEQRQAARSLLSS